MGFCAFTDASSTRDGRVVSDCRNSGRAAVAVECLRCVAGSVTTRCSHCYHKMQRAVGERCAALEKQTGCCVVEQPALRALRVIDWRALATTGDCGAEGEQYLEPLADNVWRWRVACPSCYSFNVGAVEPRVPLACREAKPQTSCAGRTTISFFCAGTLWVDTLVSPGGTAPPPHPCFAGTDEISLVGEAIRS